MIEEDILKAIDGEIFYRNDYANYLYERLEIKDLILRILKKYFREHELYECSNLLEQLLNCTINDIVWLKKMAGDDKE